ncbi:hypothetical protein TREMEDRAFT_59314 [Tremella mesenterica DSM 1558]|uniref:uncharacterized protein n=1 Tax=Tremella mesenterica (strain ATCC 24925 / CBS 8224 / DSM 1558 / NBRC 9311 / NRRL Y-6157 / RJB 2259-6 / UBC 559-6) TaxID=578456 RepID=UPI0003F49519|nr:uncharacterized protein TREMEDRAFT_59314 [Tremella mesenterica DSM 1558]EIW73152.1 hypothetical protein TREMEDRAFT_59314 [Tremella mesenterica DSM 1558]
MSTFTSNQTLPFDSCIHTWDANEMMVDDHTGYSSDENLEQPDEPSFPFVDPTDDDESQYVFNTQSQQSQWFQPPSTFPQSGGFNDQVDIDKLTNRITELEVDPRKKTKRGQSGKGALTTNTTLANRTNTGRHGRKNSKRFEPTSPTSSTAIVHHRKKRQDSGSYSKNIDKAFEALTDVIMTDYPTDQSNTVVGENSHKDAGRISDV